jgi:integrase
MAVLISVKDKNGKVKPKLVKGGKRSQYVIQIRDMKLNTQYRTGTDNLHDAKRVLRAINDRIYAMKQHRQDEFHSYSLKEQRAFITTGKRPVNEQEQGQTLTLNKAVEIYLVYLRDVRKRSAYYIYSLETYYLKRPIEKFGKDFDVRELTHKKISNYIEDFGNETITNGKNRGSTRSIRSQETYFTTLHGLYKFLAGKTDVGINLSVFQGIDFIRPNETIFDQLEQWCSFEERRKELKELGIAESEENAFKNCIFNKAELDELITYLTEKLWKSEDEGDKRLFASIMFTICTACRRSELPRLRKRDFLLEYGEATLHRMKGRKDKQWNRHKVIWGNMPISIYIEEWVEQIDNDNDCVFVADSPWINEVDIDETADRRQAEALTRQFKEALQGSKWHNAAHFHRFRHTLASLMLNAEVSQEEIKNIIGWGDDSMVKRYAHIQIRTRSEAIQRAYKFTE